MTLHLAVSIGPLVRWSVRNIFKFRAVFLFYCSCSNRSRLDWSVFSVSLSVCQFVNLSVCQFCQSVSLSVCQSVNLLICQFVILFSLLICQLFSLSTCYYASLLVCQFVSQVVYYAIVYLVFRPSVCLLVHEHESKKCENNAFSASACPFAIGVSLCNLALLIRFAFNSFVL